MILSTSFYDSSQIWSRLWISFIGKFSSIPNWICWYFLNFYSFSLAFNVLFAYILQIFNSFSKSLRNKGRYVFKYLRTQQGEERHNMYYVSPQDKTTTIRWKSGKWTFSTCPWLSNYMLISDFTTELRAHIFKVLLNFKWIPGVHLKLTLTNWNWWDIVLSI